jgi:RNA polymerase-binding transcription factor DksA
MVDITWLREETWTAMALTEQQLAGLRRRLEEELRRLNADVAYTQHGYVDADSEYDAEFSPLANHPADAATETFTQENELAIEGLLTATREQVEHALARMDEGTYGLCEVCGREIPYERLEAIPYATLDVEHQAQQDPPPGDPVEDPAQGLEPV